MFCVECLPMTSERQDGNARRVGVPDAAGFWRDCETRARHHDSDQVLTWMWMIVEAAEHSVERLVLVRHPVRHC